MSVNSWSTTLPCLEHSTQTVRVAPSIFAVTGSEWILRPQTSHRMIKCSPFSVFIMLLCLYLSKQQHRSDDEAMENAERKSQKRSGLPIRQRSRRQTVPRRHPNPAFPRTGRIRYINHKGERLATLRPTDGLLSLSIKAAQIHGENIPEAKCFVTVKNDVSKYIAKGGDVFAVHVVKVDNEVGAKDEVIAVDEDGKVLAVGRTMLSSAEISRVQDRRRRQGQTWH